MDQRRRLKEDLVALGVPRPLAPAFFEEVFYSVYPRVHERRVALFGAMTLSPYEGPLQRLGVVQPPLPFPLPDLLTRTWADQHVDLARQLADGQSTFVLASGAERVSLLNIEGRADELTLARLVRADGYASVQRTGDGKVRLFLPELLATHTRNIWTVKPYSSAMKWPLDELNISDIGQRILDLAVHVLSASNVGATIFWSQRDDWRTSPALDQTKAVEVFPQPLDDQRVFAGIRNVAAQNDRAIVVDPAGSVRSIGVTLKYPTVSDDTETDGGMRHNSAMKASVEDTESIVVVCSEDGPVSVFFQGQKIASFAEARWREACGSCGGSGQIEQVTYDPAGEAQVEKVSCPNCGGGGWIWMEQSILPSQTAPGSRTPRLYQLGAPGARQTAAVGKPRDVIDPRQRRLAGL